MLTNHSVNKIVVQSTALENSAVASTSATRGNHAYATDAVTIRGKKSTAASTGGNLWAFNGDSPVDTQASLSMTLTNATIANGVLTLPANGSASSAEADIGSALTGSYQIGFNIKAGAAALTVYVVITPNQKNRILFRRLKYSADNSTFQMFANGVPVALNMSGYTAATAFAADIPSPAKVYFGGAF
eukprot:jgi/Mesvir1/9037/Mv21320-RA.1